MYKKKTEVAKTVYSRQIPNNLKLFWIKALNCRSSASQMPFKIDVLKTDRKTPVPESLFNKVSSLGF